MTEFWKSNPMYWCEYCKVWMQDNPQARATHEKGIKHKDNVARKLRQMRQNADKAARDERLATDSMDGIEARARKQYERDLQEAQEAQRSLAGEWVHDDKAGLHYNTQHRWYFDRSTSMYYGGNPPAWTNEPKLPKEALFDERPHEDAAAPPQPQPKAAAVLPAAAAAQKKRAHPMSQPGGYQMPTTGAIGGAKQLLNSHGATIILCTAFFLLLPDGLLDDLD
ncbi:hypothetical protein WJX73_000889 [Symbiochloris irregularis]|uniref:Matrin-type domain-containing protein n=1 Tax=Symbiochloris irregularis TaxID=706552 RepID=A0AAW1PMG2_9CHLO